MRVSRELPNSFKLFGLKTQKFWRVIFFAKLFFCCWNDFDYFESIRSLFNLFPAIFLFSSFESTNDLHSGAKTTFSFFLDQSGKKAEKVSIWQRWILLLFSIFFLRLRKSCSNNNNNKQFTFPSINIPIKKSWVMLWLWVEDDYHFFLCHPHTDTASRFSSIFALVLPSQALTLSRILSSFPFSVFLTLPVALFYHNPHFLSWLGHSN